jgi:hypothetical protein
MTENTADEIQADATTRRNPMTDNTIAWMVAKPIQDARERKLRESAEARELRTILAAGQPGRARPTPLAALAARLGSVVARPSTEPSCCSA